jgi:hypothetical protein
MPDIPNLKLYYIMYLLNTAISYFYTYKRTLIIANQNHISTAYNQIFTIIRNVAQIVLLCDTRDSCICCADSLHHFENIAQYQEKRMPCSLI